MTRFNITNLTRFLLISFFLTGCFSNIAQNQDNKTQNNDFAKNLRFGGGLGLGFGSGYTDIMIAPSAIYQVNNMVAVGIGLQGSYVESKNYYTSFMYGGSIIGLFNPIPEIQLSAELEQLRVNNSYKTTSGPDYDRDFWNTALFLGAGYNTGNVTVGLRYNVLYNKINNVKLVTSPDVLIDENDSVTYIADTTSGHIKINNINEGVNDIMSINGVGPSVIISKETTHINQRDVVVNDNTASAVNFNDGTTNDIKKNVSWALEGGAMITDSNKLYGDYSVQVSKLGDCLSTTSTVFNTNEPYTLSFDMVYSGVTRGSSRTDFIASVFTKNTNTDHYLAIETDKGSFQWSIPYISLDVPKLKINDVNRYVMSYDGSSTRLFVNDELYAIGGGKMNLSYSTPLRFGYHEAGTWSFGTIGVYDNINFQLNEFVDHTNNDTHREKLLIDLALDGVDGSKSIIDSGNYNLPSIETYINVDIGLTEIPQSIEGLNIVGGVSYSDDGALVNTSNYLYIDNITLGDEPFIIEFDALATSQNSSGYSSPIIQWGTAKDATDGFAIENYLTTDTLSFRTAYGSMTSVASNIELNKFYNIKVSYDGLTTVVYVNGNPITVQNGNGMGETKQLMIGSGVGSWYNSRDKRIKSFKIFKGVSLHGGSIRVFGDAKLSTTNKFQGVSSLLLSKTTDYLFTNMYDLNFTKGTDFTISMEIMRSDSLKYDVLLANGSEGDIVSLLAVNPSDHPTHPNKLYIIGDVNELGVRSRYSCIKYDIIANVAYKIDVVASAGILYMYINNKLDSTHVIENDYNFSRSGTYIGYATWSIPDSFTGNLKNIRLYNTAVHPIDTTSKIKLDFNDNVLDSYGNSTWTATTVTYSSVLAYKLSSATFTQDSKLTTDSTLLNFGTSNFDVSFDIRETNKISGREVFSSNLPPTDPNSIWFASSATTTGLDFGDRSSLIGSSGNLLNSTSLTNTFYHERVKRLSNMVLSSKNGIPSRIMFIPKSKQFNFIGGGLFTIGKPSTTFGSSYPGFSGNIDNFEVGRDIDFIDEFDLFRTSTSCTATILNQDVNLKSIASNGIAIKNKSIPSTNSFKFKTKLKKGTGEMSIILGATDWSLTSMVAYIVSISGTNLVLSRGLNPLSAPSLTPITAYTQLDSELTEYDITIESSNGDVKVYVGTTLCINAVVEEQLLSNRVGFGSYFGATYSIDYYEITTIDDATQIFYRDWIEPTAIDINLPVVDLPLKKSVINVGFMPTTLSSPSVLTHAVIEGVQCVRCEYNKFITIPQYNTFALGLGVDFCIRFRAYSLDSAPSNWKKLFSIVDNSVSVEMRSTSNSTGQLYIWNTPTVDNNYLLNKWTTITIYRRNGVTKCIIDDIVFDLPNMDVGGTQQVCIGNGVLNSSTDYFNGYIADFIMFAGRSDIPSNYNNVNVLNLNFKPTNKSYLFEDTVGRNVLHPNDISQREYVDGMYGCKFNGTTQYIQISDSNNLNLGYDDFIMRFSFRVVKDNTWNILIGNGSTSNDGNYSYVGISDTNDCVYLTIQNATTVITSNKVNYDAVNECIVTRSGGLFTVTLNGIDTISESPNAFLNLNYGGITKIGSTSTTGWLNHLFSGVIYEVQIARFTSDVSDLINNSNESSVRLLTVSNGDLQNTVDISKSKSSTDLDFALSDTTFNITVDNGNISQPYSNTGQNTISISNFIDTIVYDSDVSTVEDAYVFEKHVTQMPEIEVIDDTGNALMYTTNRTNQTFSGFVEGGDGVEYIIHNSVNQMVASGIDDYVINDVDYRYDKYTITIDGGKTYQVPKRVMERGFISGVVDVGRCAGSTGKIKPTDMRVWCYVHEDQRFIGSYPVAADGLYTIPNLDATSRYDLIFKHNNRIIESINSSYRKPKRVIDPKTPNIVNLDYIYNRDSGMCLYTWRNLINVTYDSLIIYKGDNPIIDEATPKIILGVNDLQYRDYGVMSDQQYYITICATYNGNEYRSKQLLVNTYSRTRISIDTAEFDAANGTINVGWTQP